MRLRNTPPIKSRRAFRSSLKGSLTLEKKNISGERLRQKQSPPPLSDSAATALAALDYAAKYMSHDAPSSSSVALVENEVTTSRKKVPKQILVAGVNEDERLQEEHLNSSIEKDAEVEDHENFDVQNDDEDEKEECCCLFCGVSLAGLDEDASNEHLKVCVAIVKSQRSQRTQLTRIRSAATRLESSLLRLDELLLVCSTVPESLNALTGCTVRYVKDQGH